MINMSYNVYNDKVRQGGEHMAEKKSNKKPFNGDRWGDIKATPVDPSKIKWASKPKKAKK